VIRGRGQRQACAYCQRCGERGKRGKSYRAHLNGDAGSEKEKKKTRLGFPNPEEGLSKKGKDKGAGRLGRNGFQKEGNIPSALCTGGIGGGGRGGSKADQALAWRKRGR